MRTSRFRLLAGLAALAAATAFLAPGASAAPGAVDIAVPIWQSGGTVYSVYHGVDCSNSTNNTYWNDGDACKFTLSTVTSGVNCARETITAPDVTPMPLVNGPTACTAVISGRVDTTPTNGGCMLTANQTLVVSFSSGTLSAFNSTFAATAVFVPKSVSATDTIKSYHVTLTGGGPTNNGDATSAATIKGKFDLTFTKPLIGYCPNNDDLTKASAKGPLNKIVAADTSTITITL